MARKKQQTQDKFASHSLFILATVTLVLLFFALRAMVVFADGTQESLSTDTYEQKEGFAKGVAGNLGAALTVASHTVETMMTDLATRIKKCETTYKDALKEIEAGEQQLSSFETSLKGMELQYATAAGSIKPQCCQLEGTCDGCGERAYQSGLVELKKVIQTFKDWLETNRILLKGIKNIVESNLKANLPCVPDTEEKPKQTSSETVADRLKEALAKGSTIKPCVPGIGCSSFKLPYNIQPGSGYLLSYVPRLSSKAVALIKGKRVQVRPVQCSKPRVIPGAVLVGGSTGTGVCAQFSYVSTASTTVTYEFVCRPEWSFCSGGPFDIPLDYVDINGQLMLSAGTEGCCTLCAGSDLPPCIPLDDIAEPGGGGGGNTCEASGNFSCGGGGGGGTGCTTSSECQSGFCDNGKCTEPPLLNGSGQGCTTDADCYSGKCMQGQCVQIIVINNNGNPSVVSPSRSAPDNNVITKEIERKVSAPEVSTLFGLNKTKTVRSTNCIWGAKCSNTTDCCGADCDKGYCSCGIAACSSSGECCYGYCEEGACVIAPTMAAFAFSKQINGCAGFIEECLPGEGSCFTICNALLVFLGLASVGAGFVAWNKFGHVTPALAGAIIPCFIGMTIYPFAGSVVAIMLMAMLYVTKEEQFAPFVEMPYILYDLVRDIYTVMTELAHGLLYGMTDTSSSKPSAEPPKRPPLPQLPPRR
jgi:uncharacterized protein YukE